ncbi:MAG: patatin-like phospholipase family protein [Polyangiaceae bacterium]
MTSDVPRTKPKTGLVLSGGGMRGAYEVGIVAGIMEVLDPEPGSGPTFQIFAGTSVGAINATYLASNAAHADHGVERLVEVWNSLRLEDHARLRPFGLARLPDALSRFRSKSNQPTGNSLLDSRGIEVLVRRTIDWSKLHENIDRGTIDAVMVAALHVVSGRTTMFTERAPHCHIEPTRDERKVTSFERISADHVLASAAIPLLFPTRRIGNHYYCDGGLRFNTPIAPAIRAGAERLVIVSVRHERSPRELAAVEEADPGKGRELSSLFLVGKLLNALLLDPVAYDLQVLERLNQVMEVLEETLDADDLERIQRVWIKHRGAPYRRLKKLVFQPSRDLGRVAGDFIRKSLKTTHLRPMAKYLIEKLASDAPEPEADWASYLLFDGSFAHELIEIGRQDARDQADKIREFFS